MDKITRRNVTKNDTPPQKKRRIHKGSTFPGGVRILVSENVKKHVINQVQYISTEYTELISSTFETGIVSMDSLHLFISMQKPLLIYMSAFTKRYSGTIAATQSNVYAFLLQTLYPLVLH